VILLNIRPASYYLNRALSLCPENAHQQQRYVLGFPLYRIYADKVRAILIKLITVNLLLGKLPNNGVLAKYGLQGFRRLLEAFKRGDVRGWREELEVNRDWFRRRSIWLLLSERGEILVWRNLFRSR
jgi:hypothetical protein